MLCSPARRSRETLERVEAAFGDRVKARFEEALYGASEAELLARLRALPPELDSVMIVGHNPGLKDLALALASEGAERVRMEEKYPTAALATIDLSANDGARSNGLAASSSPTSDLAIWIERLEAGSSSGRNTVAPPLRHLGS